MSPLSLRRHRAERMLREEFVGLRGRVLASVRGRLRAIGVSLDEDDLEACYATAWQGLYTAVLDGQDIANPAGWLVLVTFRRAIEEQRARDRVRCGDELVLAGGGEPASTPSGVQGRTETPGAVDADFAAELDDRVRLRQLFEALRGRLDGREREAATLCYLQGLSRSEAAARMGVSEARMRKLMEGRGPGRPGVAGKVGSLVGSIRDGEWCDEQGSLMRALAYGILDPDGERYQLALMHHGQCPACRAYVVSLRGLAAALPPVLLPWAVGAAALARAGEGLHAGVAGSGTAAGGGATGGSGVTGAGATAASASGAAGAGGVAGGGWLVGAGPLGAKLAVGCLLALGVGAGCVALDAGNAAHRPRHGHQRISRAAGARVASAGSLGAVADGVARPAAAPARVRALTPAAQASREFGPQALASGSSATAGTAARRASIARSVSSGSSSSSDGGSSVGGSGGGGAAATSQAAPGAQPHSDAAAAQREFAPG